MFQKRERKDDYFVVPMLRLKVGSGSDNITAVVIIHMVFVSVATIVTQLRHGRPCGVRNAVMLISYPMLGSMPMVVLEARLNRKRSP